MTESVGFPSVVGEFDSVGISNLDDFKPQPVPEGSEVIFSNAQIIHNSDGTEHLVANVAGYALIITLTKVGKHEKEG